MKQVGPPLPLLLRRIAATPGEFTQSPSMGSEDGVDTAAVVSDLLFDNGGDLLDSEEAKFYRPAHNDANRYHLGLILLLCHLYHDDWFTSRKRFSQAIRSFLEGERLRELAKTVKFTDFINDPERREELARLALWALDLLPEGEDGATAADRLTTLDSVERRRIVEKSREAKERARQVREAMERQAAEEAASKMSRE